MDTGLDDDALTAEIIHDIRSLKMAISKSIRRRIPRNNLTESQINAIYDLVRRDGQTLSELSERLSLSHSTVSGIIDRLEAKGLVIREKDLEDARRTRIFMSGKMKAGVKEFTESNHLPLRCAVDAASTEEKAKIAEGLSILTRLVLANEEHDKQAEKDERKTRHRARREFKREQRDR